MRRLGAARPSGPAVWLALVLAVGVLVVGPIRPAAAHTALLGSSPASGDRLAYSPDEIVLSFAAPVDVRTVGHHLRTADGEEIAVEVATPGPTADVVAFEVPRLAQGTYGFAWESVGDDGHRLSGEVVFGVGTAPGATGSIAGGGDPLATALDLSALAGRVAWYVGLALAAGVAALGIRATTLPGALARRRVPGVLAVLAGAAALRGVVGALIVLEAGGGIGRALGSRPPLWWAAVAVGVWALRWVVVHRPAVLARTSAARALGVAAGLAVLGGTVAGHAPTRPDPAVAIAVGAVHVAAAAAWVGPLLVLALMARTPAWRALDDDERRATLRRAMATVARTAGWALAAVAASGALLALRAWDGSVSTSFAWALGIKLAVVAAIAVPLGVLHHRTRDRWSAVPRTVRIEAAGLVVAMVLGGVLVGVDPGWSGGSGEADIALEALLDGTATDPAACADLDVGRAACVRTALEQVLVAEGPQAAIDIVAELSTTDDHVMANCHQVAHDLGNDASERIDDMATALAVEGSVCWSGYYHGFVEARLAAVSTDDLTAALPTFCESAAEPRYSFTHYNCLHGLGHGLMLRVDSNLFDALPLCDATGEEWAIHSCASGVFMENVIAAQQGLDTGGFDDEDLLHPCTAVDDLVAGDCYLMQTSYVLWRLDGDVPAAFGWCDTAPEAHRTTCYRSMGRDISSRAALDPVQVVELCAQGRADLVRWCIDGAASNAVYEQAGTDAADALCAAVTGDLRTACTEARDTAAGIVAAG
ncbi:copper resistance protein CopC [Euzebya sp.]|uniref:copper resistance CopC family protein n=1 Tax=Euzebya sp. TaxID=1971409 RepID=UPI0035133D22